MAVPAQTSEAEAWEAVLRKTKVALETNADPNLWASQVSSTLNSSAVSLPSAELAHRLVSLFFWENHSATAWKFLHTAMSLNMLPPLLLIALLSSTVVPSRQLYPIAYRLYLELLKQVGDMLEPELCSPDYKTIMKSIDEVLQLSQLYSQKVWEPGVVLVEFIFSIVWQLLEASLDDEGLLDHTLENKPRWLSRSHDMDIDRPNSFSEKKSEHLEGLQKKNTAIAVEIIAEFLQHKVTSRILSLVHWNMSSHWGSFIHQMQLLVSNSSVFRDLKDITAKTLLLLTQNIHGPFSHAFKTKSKMETDLVTPSGSQMSFAGQSYGDSWSSLWLPIDLIMEDALDGGQVAAFSAIEIITGLVKTLHAVNGSVWHNTFLGLWVAALRLVQRERDSKHGPIPRFDTSMCMLLSITTLLVANIIEEEEGQLIEEAEHSPTNQGKDKQALRKCREELISSLQLLGAYESLLTPPQPVLVEANQAAAKAIMFLSGNPVDSGYFESISMNDTPLKCSGNLHHLIVEACIAKNLLDTSAYSWPGYVNVCSNQIPSSISNYVSGWSSLMEGSQLTPALVNVLVKTPASSLAEIEKIYEIALNGSDEEKISAATILCGASLVRGWTIQEHTVIFIIKLLTPLVPPNHSEAGSQLISQAPFINVLLVGISAIENVHIFSLHGAVPLLASGLMLICEVFGSCVPDASWNLATRDKLTNWEVFSNAFTLLLRFWRFDHLPVEQVRPDATTPPFGSISSPECLLLVRNSKLALFKKMEKGRKRLKRWSNILCFPVEPVFMDSFPKLNFWYRQHQECIASIRSGLVTGGPVYQIIDALLGMMFRKVGNDAEPLSPATSGSNSSSGPALEDALKKLKVPAWDILEAIPFVLDAALTACAYGRLSTRELATGLKDVADFLPASLVTIASYFSAEVTRGIWKPAFMNGKDWPSPAANLSLVEQQIKKMLATTGVHVPSLALDGKSPAILPLPLAAFVSLSITYKLDKASERFLALIAPAMSALASGCPWPSSPIVTSLWIHKAKRWINYFVLSACRTVFHRNRDAVVQLLKSCFTSTLQLGSGSVYNSSCVSALLGHGFGSQISNDISPIAPGILYLSVYRYIGDITFLAEEIVSILMLSVTDIASSNVPMRGVKKRKRTKFGIKYGQVSLDRSMLRVKHAALLAASLLWISGGPKLVQYLISETLPSWFLSANILEQNDGEPGATVATLRGYALAYFIFLSVAFASSVDDSNSPQPWEKFALHLKFLTSSLIRNTPIYCPNSTSEAYMSGLLSLMVTRTPSWLQKFDVTVLKTLSWGLKHIDEHDLALRLLEVGGIGVMGDAAEMIVRFKHRS